MGAKAHSLQGFRRAVNKARRGEDSSGSANRNHLNSSLEAAALALCSLKIKAGSRKWHQISAGVLSTKELRCNLKNANETQELCDVSAISSKCAGVEFPSDPAKKQKLIFVSSSQQNAANPAF